MAKWQRSIGQLALELIGKSREAALCGVHVFNDPYVSFKSETFTVLVTDNSPPVKPRRIIRGVQTLTS